MKYQSCCAWTLPEMLQQLAAKASSGSVSYSPDQILPVVKGRVLARP